MSLEIMEYSFRTDEVSALNRDAGISPVISDTHHGRDARFTGEPNYPGRLKSALPVGHAVTSRAGPSSADSSPSPSLSSPVPSATTPRPRLTWMLYSTSLRSRVTRLM